MLDKPFLIFAWDINDSCGGISDLIGRKNNLDECKALIKGQEIKFEVYEVYNVITEEEFLITIEEDKIKIKAV
jgi:hypothetical protein